MFLSTRTLVRWLGFRGMRRLGALFGALQYRFGGADRRRCLRDLAQLQSLPPGDPLVERQLREAYRVNTVAVLEVMAMFDRKLDAATLASQCRIDGLERLEVARHGQGVLLLATHSGNALLFAAQLASAGWPVTVVYRRARMMSDDFFVQGLAKYGIDGVLANEGLKAYAKMLDAVRHGRIVFATMDQGVKLAKDGVPVRFLGKDMPMPGGVAQLARATRAPVFPVATMAADPVWHFAVEPQVSLKPYGTLEKDLEALLRPAERQVLERPQLWSWHHRRWRKFPLAGRST